MKWLRRGYRALVMALGALCLGWWLYSLILQLLTKELAAILGTVLHCFS